MISLKASSIGVGAPGQYESNCDRISVIDCQMSIGTNTETPDLSTFMPALPQENYIWFCRHTTSSVAHTGSNARLRLLAGSRNGSQDYHYHRDQNQSEHILEREENERRCQCHHDTKADIIQPIPRLPEQDAIGDGP